MVKISFFKINIIFDNKSNLNNLKQLELRVLNFRSEVNIDCYNIQYKELNPC